MKELVRERGGTIALDENNNRLFLVLSDANVETYKNVIRRLNEITQEYQIKELMIDTSNREGSDEELTNFSVDQFKDIMHKGLERIAIVMSRNQKEVEHTNDFMAKMGSGSIRSFNSKQEAVAWLNSAGGEQRKAA